MIVVKKIIDISNSNNYITTSIEIIYISFGPSLPRFIRSKYQIWMVKTDRNTPWGDIIMLEIPKLINKQYISYQNPNNIADTCGIPYYLVGFINIIHTISPWLTYLIPGCKPRRIWVSKVPAIPKMDMVDNLLFKTLCIIIGMLCLYYSVVCASWWHIVVFSGWFSIFWG